jgi:uncharacterized membrane protein YgcG
LVSAVATTSSAKPTHVDCTPRLASDHHSSFVAEPLLASAGPASVPSETVSPEVEKYGGAPEVAW